MKTYRAMLKSEIARAAGVSLPTLRKWLRPHSARLAALGVTNPNDNLLNPAAVRYICETFCIDPDEA